MSSQKIGESGLPNDSSKSNLPPPSHARNLVELTTAFEANPSKAHVLDFSATWCGPCRMLEPKLEEFRAKYPNVIVLKVDVEEGEDLVAMYDVSVVPTFVVFKEGEMVETLVGSDVEKVEGLFKKYND